MPMPTSPPLDYGTESPPEEREVVVPLGGPHLADSNSEKENVPPSQKISGENNEGEGPDCLQSEPASESSWIEKENPNVSNPNWRSMEPIKRKQMGM